MDKPNWTKEPIREWGDEVLELGCNGVNKGEEVNKIEGKVNDKITILHSVAAPGFKKWGGKKGATIDYGGANMCA